MERRLATLCTISYDTLASFVSKSQEIKSREREPSRTKASVKKQSSKGQVSSEHRATQALHQEMYASTNTSSVLGDEDVPALQADIVTTSYGHDFEHRHPDGPSTRCNWTYILDEVR